MMWMYNFPLHRKVHDWHKEPFRKAGDPIHPAVYTKLSMCMRFVQLVFFLVVVTKVLRTAPQQSTMALNSHIMLTRVYFLHPYILSYTAFIRSTKLNPEKILTLSRLAPWKDSEAHSVVGQLEHTPRWWGRYKVKSTEWKGTCAMGSVYKLSPLRKG